jgi:hypothetical protein
MNLQQDSWQRENEKKKKKKSSTKKKKRTAKRQQLQKKDQLNDKCKFMIFATFKTDNNNFANEIAHSYV